jgi:membrane-associated tyrosine/threonine-specific cdc2-inhibitory kinase
MQGNVSTKADVFSLGMTLLEIACHVDLPTGGELWHKLRHGGPFPLPTDACEFFHEYVFVLRDFD